MTLVDNNRDTSENMFHWCHSQLQNSQSTPMFGSLWLKFQCFDITANVSPYDLQKHA